MYSQITPTDLDKRLKNGEAIQLVDVREPDEFAIASIGGTLIPLGEIVTRYQELDPQLPTAVLCHHGVRSARAAQFLLSVGFTHVMNISGGIDRWSREVDPAVRTY